jgi:aminoglycoside phosphotransferase family enzyme
MSRIPDIVQALLDPGIYPDKSAEVKLIQTQMSWLFMTDRHVYKVKKPVNLGYLDYTTMESRYYFCRQEIRLNRRLCPKVYLGVVPITSSNGTISIGGHGQAIDYAVKMHRLPEDRMMNVMLLKGQVTPNTMTEVASVLADFHHRTVTNFAINIFGTVETITKNTQENFEQTKPYIDVTIAKNRYQLIKDFTEDFIQQNQTVFERRMRGGRIKDCHGDLHAAHICLTDDICIYDCIEFNERFRYGDVAAEVAFLAMDLDHFGFPNLSRSFVEAYIESSEDPDILTVLVFYKCYRAYVRGKVESFKLNSIGFTENERNEARVVSDNYFVLAEQYARQ